MTYLIRSLSIAILLGLFSISGTAYAQLTSEEAVKAYTTTVHVNLDNSANVTETILYQTGNQARHGMSVLNADATSDIKLDSKADFSKFWQAWTILNAKYATTPKHPGATSEDKVYGAIKGLAESYGDPYTTFFTPVEEKQFREEISGNFEGVS
jgi:C-terminal processing protease CtpA/Prc